ncbi:MAG: CdaR family protein [Flavobacteriaceae bacterium]|nr:CdaR family protein [Flavobacteriaceae bacterium]MDG1761500.1 CdaR family protein [Flavobacteriaceae bacterium]|tara:strand:+ start:745 stop:1707 length:963 start_codon:yes stop_codon:yes gene_type:complete
MFNNPKGLESFLEVLPSKGRFRFFLFFLLLSFTFWTSTKLSNTYIVEESFSIIWINIPNGIIPSSENQQMNVSISASGIEILIYRLINKSINISLSQADFSREKGLVDLRGQEFFIQKQFFENTKLNILNPLFLEFKFSRLEEKVFTVVPQIEINLRAGYLIDSSLKVTPDSILVRGPKSILDTLNSIQSESIIADDLYENFRKKVSLRSIPEIQLSESKVTVEVAVSRYTEKEFLLNIEVINLPLGTRVKLFPPKAKVRVTLPLSVLRTIKASDFNLVVDYNNIFKDAEKKLDLIMIRRPSSVKKVILEPKKVNYLIRK